MDGWAVLTALKADPTLADIPVIIVTLVDEKHVGYTLGAVDYLTKPIDWRRLPAVLQKYQRADPFCRVLLVEDDARTRKILRTRLEKQGWPVIGAENGRVALERMAESLPDLILLDLMMPEVDGFQFLDHVRTHEGWRYIPNYCNHCQRSHRGGPPATQWLCREGPRKGSLQPRRAAARGSRPGDSPRPLTANKRRGGHLMTLLRAHICCKAAEGRFSGPWKRVMP